MNMELLITIILICVIAWVMTKMFGMMEAPAWFYNGAWLVAALAILYVLYPYIKMFA